MKILLPLEIEVSGSGGMSLPHANNLTLGELQMALHHVSLDDRISVIYQRFVGSGISCEALLMFNDSNFEDIARLMPFDEELN